MAEKRTVRVERKTAETDITLELEPDSPGSVKIDTGIPFFDHMLHAMAFHGGFGLDLVAKGDLLVDFHHTVEDTGLALGEAFWNLTERFGPVERFGHAVIPMDEALAEVTLDVCGRPTAVFRADFPQPACGLFETALVREFFTAFANSSRSAVHAECRYGLNSHHMAEALYKSLGKALAQAYRPSTLVRSTKGSL
jgi:imidazoleglycerol-phosphate dehydratase